MSSRAKGTMAARMAGWAAALRHRRRVKAGADARERARRVPACRLDLPARLPTGHRRAARRPVEGWRLRLGPGLVDHERSTLECVAVELRDGRLRAVLRAHRDEGKAARAAGRHVPHHAYAVHLSGLAEQRAQLFIRGLVREIPDIQSPAHRTAPSTDNVRALSVGGRPRAEPSGGRGLLAAGCTGRAASAACRRRARVSTRRQYKAFCRLSSRFLVSRPDHGFPRRIRPGTLRTWLISDMRHGVGRPSAPCPDCCRYWWPYSL